MERLQRALDALFRDLRRGAILREHAFSIFFFATLAALVRQQTATWSLDSFAGREIGQSTLENVSVGARTAVYVQACILFLLVAALGAYVFPRVAKRLGAGVGRALEATSACGLIMLLLAAWRVEMRSALVLLVGAQVLVVAPVLLDRVLARGAGREPAMGDVGGYAAWLGATAFALLEPIVDFGRGLPHGIASFPALIVAFGLGLDALRRIACALPPGGARGRASRSDRFVHALAPLAALAAARTVRNELYLLANGAGYLSVRPEWIEVGYCALIGAWCAVRAVRGPRGAQLLPDGRLDVERLIGRLTFPWILCGAYALTRFMVHSGNSPEFLEPANGALMIQQWFDFGRLPFFETFSAHGLSDSFFGFIFAALTGFREATWVEYDYLWFLVTILIGYHVLRAWWSSATAALFCALIMPRSSELLPTFFIQSALTIFLVRWVMSKRSAFAWAVFAAWIAAVFAWRLDLGFANALAALATLAALVVLLPEYRPPFGAIARGWLGFAAAFFLVYFGVCAWRGVDAIGLLLDFKAVISSNQAFGYAQVATDRNEIVVLHMFVMPILVMVTCLALFWRVRGHVEARDKAFFAVIGTVFMGAYYFANYPRGLVRHSFIEAPNVALSSFAFFVLAGAWRWWMPEGRRLVAFALFFLTGTALCYELDLGSQRARKLLAPTTTYERLAYAVRTTPRVPYEPQRIARTLDQDWFDDMVRDIRSFVAAELAPEETFLDLSSSPMLYFHTHRRSPHWLNHTLLVYGERLQKSFLAALEHDDIPFVLSSPMMSVDPPQVVPPFDVLDSVPFTLRQYRLFEWMYARYDPLCMVGKWAVWVRKDRLLCESPALQSQAGGRRLFSLAEARARGDAHTADPVAVQVLAEPRVQVAGPIDLAPDKVRALRIVGTAEHGATLDVEVGFGGERDVDPLQRALVFPAGRAERWFWIPRRDFARTLTALSLQARGPFQLDALELWEYDAPGARALGEDLDAGRTTNMGKLAWLWGTYDEEASDPPKILRTLAGTEVDYRRGTLLPEAETDGDRPHGIERNGAAFRLSSSVRGEHVAVGDRLLFGDGGVRTVTAVDGPTVRVSGAPLQPERDGNPRLVRFVAPEAEAGTLTRPRHPLDYPFAPIAAAERAHGTYLRLRLRATTGEGSRMVVAYGAGELGLGKFVFDLCPDEMAHDYAVRLSTQANWTLHDCDWLRLIPALGGVEVEGAWLTAGD